MLGKCKYWSKPSGLLGGGKFHFISQSLVKVSKIQASHYDRIGYLHYEIIWLQLAEFTLFSYKNLHKVRMKAVC